MWNSRGDWKKYQKLTVGGGDGNSRGGGLKNLNILIPGEDVGVRVGF